jgi:hypothetical protein
VLCHQRCVKNTFENLLAEEEFCRDYYSTERLDGPPFGGSKKNMTFSIFFIFIKMVVLTIQFLKADSELLLN